jgi:protoporphyrinogen oxidase
LNPKIAIIGAGACGLSAAYELVKNGCDVTVFEESEQVGGLSAAHEINGALLDNIYHHIFTSDAYVTRLAEELGLEKHLQWKEPRDAFYVNNTLYPFTSPADLLKFSHLPFFHRVTMGLLVLRARFIKDMPEEQYAGEWVAKLAGKPVYEKVWKPLLESKFDADAAEISAVWLWNKFKLRGSTRGKDISKELLGYMDGSFSRLYEALRGYITARGGKVLLGAKARKLSKTPGGWEIACAGSNHAATAGGVFDAALFTAAPALLNETCPGLNEDYRGKISQIKYKANLCAVLYLKKPLSRFYWTTVADREIPFVAVIEHTHIVPPAAYGSHVAYLTRYLDAADPLYGASDGEIRELFTRGLIKIYPELNLSDITGFRLFRSRYAQPVIVKGYHKTLPDTRTPDKGLYLASMAQIYPEDRGQNYAIREGINAAKLILAAQCTKKGLD